MSALVIKNVPDELHAKLKAQARRNHRSLTGEVMAMLEQGIMREPVQRPLPPPIKLKGGGPLTIEEMKLAIEDGRD